MVIIDTLEPDQRVGETQSYMSEHSTSIITRMKCDNNTSNSLNKIPITSLVMGLVYHLRCSNEREYNNNDI